jgi:hypothetical protein
MGCNCGKGKKQTINNLQSVDHISAAKEVFTNVISQREIADYTELDKMDVFNTYAALYPNSKYVPTLDNAVENIKHAINNFKK